jgi:hypothetical protein
MSARTTRLAVVLAVFTLSSAVASAETSSLAKNRQSGSFDEPGTWGIGAALTSIGSGVSAKTYLGGPWALQGTLGVGYGWGLGLNLSVDGLYEMPRFLSNDAIGMNWYLGAGASVGGGLFGVSTVLYTPAFVGYGGFQILGGVALQLHKIPMEFAVEIRPTFLFAPAYFFPGWWGSGISARYFF